MTVHSNGRLPQDPRSAAQYYLRLGYIPVPVPRTGRGKAPALEGWQELRPRLEDLDALFPEDPPVNVGLLLGEPSGGLLDIDLDVSEALVAAPLLLPGTGWVSGRQSKPRSHWWYLVCNPPDKAADEYRDLDGTMLLEVRSTRAQTVAPPSIHETGEPIVWDTFARPATVNLSQLQAAARAIAAVALLARHWPAKGSRQDAFMALAGGLLRAGWPLERVRSFIGALAAATQDEEARKRTQTVAQTVHKKEQQGKVTGWPTLERLLGQPGQEVVARVQSWLARPAADGGNSGNPGPPWPDPVPLCEAPPVPPFPTAVLPPRLRQLVEEISWALHCPADYVGLPLLTLAGGALANARHLAITNTHHQAPCIFAAYVGRPGTVKSRPLRLLRRPFDVVQARWLQEWQDQMDAWDHTEPEERGAKPVLNRCIVSDTTTESLGLTLNDNPRGVVMIRNELAALMTSLNQYKGGKGYDRQVYLNLWDGDPILIDRKSDKSRAGAPLHVQDPFTAIIGTLQPDVLPLLRGDAARAGRQPDDGFTDRFLITYPQELPAVGEQWRQVSEDALQAWQEVVEGLLGLEMVRENDGCRPFFVRLTRCGRIAWQRFTDAHAAEMNDEDFPAFLFGPWSKLKGYCGRLALILHALRWIEREVPGEDVDGESVGRAAKLIAYFKAHARKVFLAMEADGRIGEARKLLHWLRSQQRQRFQKRDAYQALKGTVKTVEHLEPVLALLEKQGWIRPEPSPERYGPGRKPSPYYEAHPSLAAPSDHNSHNSQNGVSQAQADGVQGDVETPPASPQFTKNGRQHPQNNGTGYCGDGAAHSGQLWEDCPEEAASPQIPPSPEDGSTAEDSGDCGNCGDGGPDKGTPAPRPLRSPDAPGRGSSAPAYQWIREGSQLGMVATALDNTARVGVDLETTGLDFRTDRVRLLSLATDTIDGGTLCYLVDCFAVDPAPLWPALADKKLVFHNAAFDLGMLAHMGFTPTAAVHDTLLLAQLLLAGTHEPASLEACCQRWLGRPLDKSEQTSDWSGELRPEQLGYAAADAAVLRPLLEVLQAEVEHEELARAAGLEQRALPAVVWLAHEGVALDRQRWLTLADEARAEAERLREEMDRAAPAKPGELFSPWNWDSPPQVREVLSLAGCPVEDTQDSTLAGVAHPLAGLLRRYRAARKRVSGYGASWLEHVGADGRVYPSWKQLGAVTGRMSCSTPNMQQLPRGGCRRCVVAPQGRVLVKADWSQLHLHIIAGVAPEPAMQEAFRQGLDLHTLTARRLTGKEEVSKEERQRAKAAAFGLCYGMGAERFQAYALSDYGLELSAEEAARLRRDFFRAYPGLKAWHRRQADGEVTVRAPSGRSCRTVKKFSDKLSYAILLIEADCLKDALGLLWERRNQVPGAFPVLACHDELVVECGQDQSEEVESWLVGIMLEAAEPWLSPVPVEVSATIGTSWGGGEVRAEKTYRSGGG